MNLCEGLLTLTSLYKKKHGHTNIKESDTIDSFDIGHRLLTIRNIYKCGRLTEENKIKLDDLGICLKNIYEKEFEDMMELARKSIKDGIIISRLNKFYDGVDLCHWVLTSVKTRYSKGSLSYEDIKIIEKLVGKSVDDFYMSTQHKEKFDLCVQAINEGVTLGNSNRMYKGVNLFCWIKNNKNKFSDEELEIVNQLIPPCPQNIPIRIIDIKTNNCSEYVSISEAGRALHNTFNIVDSDNKGIKTIHSYITGKIKNPIYKGRFRFEYVKDESGDDKAS